MKIVVTNGVLTIESMTEQLYRIAFPYLLTFGMLILTTMLRKKSLMESRLFTGYLLGFAPIPLFLGLIAYVQIHYDCPRILGDCYVDEFYSNHQWWTEWLLLYPGLWYLSGIGISVLLVSRGLIDIRSRVS